jgi:hypothetical protein
MAIRKPYDHTGNNHIARPYGLRMAIWRMVRKPAQAQSIARIFSVYIVAVGLRGFHDKQSLSRPEPRLEVTSILLEI